MLRELRVANLALVDELVLPLDGGLTMLTGETGAGKSLIAGALTLLAGGKADQGLIRDGEELTYVEGVFDLAQNQDAVAVCAALGIRLGTDGVLVLRRELRREGRGRVLINGLVSSLALLEDIGGRLLAVQSQDQQRRLGQPSFGREFLDAALELDEELAAVQASLRLFREADGALVERRREEESARLQLDMWTYQHRELAELNLDPDELGRLDEALAVGRNARALLEGADRAMQALCDGQPDARQLLGAAERALAPLENTSGRIAKTLRLIREAETTVSEAVTDLGRFVDELEVDPRRLDEMEERRAGYQLLCRKYGRDAPELVALRDDLERNIERQRVSSSDVDALAARRDAARDSVTEAALALRKRREDGAGAMAERAAALIRPLSLAELGLRILVVPDLDPESPFAIEGQACRVTTHGADRVVLEVRTNRGEPFGEVARVASGGEKSRIFLGLSMLCDQRTERSLLLFDEIDAGLGMDNARPVAELLARMAVKHQVLCITHLATVAVRGTRHWVVTKGAVGRRTSLAVSEVVADGRVAEIARLLGGADQDQAAAVTQVAYARELLAQG